MHLLREIRQRLAQRLRGRAAGDGDAALPRDSVRGLLAAYRADYLGGRKRITSPLNRGYFSDPLPPLSRLARQLIALLRRDPGALR